MKIIEKTVSQDSPAWEWVKAHACFTYTGNGLFPEGEQRVIVEYNPVEYEMEGMPNEIRDAANECGLKGVEYILFIGEAVASNNPGKTITVSVHCHDEYADAAPSRASFVMDDALLARIKRMSEVVRAYGLFKAESFYHSVEWFDEDESDAGYHIELVTLDVTETDFKFTGNIKHTNICVQTDGIKLSETGDLTHE